MRNTITLFFAIIAVLFTASAQNYTSVSNGNWTDPTTWSPTGVPVTFTSVTINHDVIMNIDFSYTSGTVTINPNGSLVQSASGRKFAVSGGVLENDGTFTIDTFAVMSGTFTNGGTANTSITYINGNVTNNGTWDNIDSLYNDNMLYNEGGDIYVDQFYNADYFENDGYVDAIDFFNNSSYENLDEMDMINFFNADSTYNEGTMRFNDHTNAGYFENYYEALGTNDFTNTGHYENYGLLSVTFDFMNADSTNHDAYFYNDSMVYVGNDFLNVDTIDGTTDGHFCVENNSSNSGDFYGYFDFCDQTPPASSPYIDLNTGNIDPTITYCITPCGTNITDFETITINIYPNPASKVIFIDSDTRITSFRLYDINGRLISNSSMSSNSANINIENLSSGIYTYMIKTESGIQTGKIEIK